MLCYTSEPLAADAEVSGHVVVDLWLASSEGDAAVHVYLSEVDADGTVRYVSEGVLRALHRKESEPEAKQRWSWPFRTFARADAQPMPKDKPQQLRFAMIPTSWTFRRGSRIRLAIAGGDADHYAQVPHGRPPVLTLRRGGAMASSLTLPWREVSPP
jgi:putative CocE/NonD family hydrolase